MPDLAFREIRPEDIDSINAMCVMPGSKDPSALKESKESAEEHLRAAAVGAKVFGAFLDGEPVGRIEVMPIAAAPLPLEGDGLWVIRCLWVLEKAQGRGIARSLMDLGLEVAKEAEGVAVLTYPNWMPPSFFQRFGFETVHEEGRRSVLLRKADPRAEVTLAQPAMKFTTSDDTVRVDAVFNARCPWLMQYYRGCLERARSLSERVITNEHIIHDNADALQWGEEKLYIEGDTPFDGPVRLQKLEEIVKEILTRKKLL